MSAFSVTCDTSSAVGDFSSSGAGGGGDVMRCDGIGGGVGGRGIYLSDMSSSSIQNSHHTSDNDDASQLHCSGTSTSGVRWDQDSSSGNVVQKQQKSNNISEQAQVASRLQQIRDYIGQTSSVMEQLRAAGTPQHMEQWLRLSDLLDGLKDSEMKLSRILKTFNRLQTLECDEDCNNDEQYEAGSVQKSSDTTTRTNELKIKIEESQRKLLELKEQQAALLAVKQKAQEQLKEARAAQGALLASQEQRSDGVSAMQSCSNMEERLQCLQNFYEARNELAQIVGCNGTGSDSAVGEVLQLQNKLEELQAKKMKIDQMSNQMVQQFNGVSNLAVSNPVAPANSVENCDGPVESESIEDKISELASLKELLSRMQSALSNITASHVTSSSSSTVTAANLHNNSQELGSFEEEDEDEKDFDEMTNLRIKQDNRTQAVSHSHALQSAAGLTTMSCASSAASNNNNSSLSCNAAAQQLHVKSLKLQEAKARLQHLQELLNVVEEFREAGKPVPQKVLLLLSSPNGPLSGEDNLDLGELNQSQSHQVQTSSSSSSTSSLLSLLQLNGSTANSAHRSAPSHQSNRSDVNLQNLYQPEDGVTRHPPQQQPPKQVQQPPPVAVKHNKNNVTKLCAKTQELEEWMRKDDPITCINTDTHSQQQQAGYNTSSYGYQEFPTTSATWRGSTDYSSDDGGRSDEDNDGGMFIQKASSSLSVSGAIKNGGVVGSGSASGSASVISKEQSLASGSGPPRYVTMSQ